MSLRCDPEEIARGIRLYVQPGSVVELRALDVERGGTSSGYFNDPDALAQAARRLSGNAKGLYITLNPVLPDLLARAVNRVQRFAKVTTADAEIVHRRWLAVDVDSKRPVGISATHEEKAAGLALTRDIRDWLNREHGIVSALIDSGNGGQLAIPIDLPNDEESRNLVERVLKALATRFDNDAAHVDQTIFNAARILKMPGTLACKGDSTAERPHRLSRILELPESLPPASVVQLTKVAGLIPDSLQPEKRSCNPGAGDFDLPGWIKERLPDAGDGEPWRGGRKWNLPVCPFNEAHTDGDAAIIQMPSGAVAFHCFHNGCKGRDWHAVRDRLEPGWRQRNGAKPPAHGDADVPPPRSAAVASERLRERRAEAPNPLRSRAVTRCLAAVEPEPVNWVWDGRVPQGKLTVLDGDPGNGKSLVTLDIAARVSTGREMPDCTPNGLGVAAGVVLVGVEDGVADTVVPRLRAAGGDLSRIITLDGVACVKATQDLAPAPQLVNVADVGVLEDAIVEVNARLMIVDPLTAFLPPGCDSHNDAKVRAALAPLCPLAERTGCAILLVRHLNKQPGGKALYRGGGSIAITGIARSVLLAAPDPTDQEGVRRVLAVSKNNLAARPPSLAYRIEETATGAVAIRWEGEVHLTADALLAASQRISPERAELIDFLEASDEELDAPAIAAALGWPPARVRQHLSKAADAGQIVRVGTGMYRAHRSTQPSQPHNAHSPHSSAGEQAISK